MEDLVNIIKKAVIEASTVFRDDQIAAYKAALKKESNDKAAWFLELLIENAEIAGRNSLPLCDDTGIPHVLIEVGTEAYISVDFLENIKKGIEHGLKELPGRPMAVRGGGLDRIDQSQGLYSSPEMVTAPSFLIDRMDNDGVNIHILMLGGGPEIRAKTFRVYHRRDHRKVFEEVLTWLKPEIANLGCTPCIPAIGVGRTHFEASSLMLKSMAYGNLDHQSEWEQRITDSLNETGIGSMGLGGAVTALGTFLQIGPQRASGVRIVSVRPCCCMEPRRSSVNISSKFLE